VFKKLLIAVGLGSAVYWFAKKRGHKDEFTFTEYPNDGSGS
jgi:hypothetical protein